MNLPVFFISHGGGPWPWMDSLAGHYAGLSSALRQLPAQTGTTPKAILMISAHWEEPTFSLPASSNPGMIYDYHGFPEETYEVSYPAPGAPWLARQVKALLENAGLQARLDDVRGLDHGMYCPLVVAYPEADVPVVQLSPKDNLDPEEQLALGHALSPLREQEILIIGSGLSYHNLRNLGPGARQVSAAFDGWMHDVATLADPLRREAELIRWEQAPSAREAHPREEHLLPLMVAVGAAGGDAAERAFHQDDFMGGVSVSNYIFGSVEHGK